MISRNICLIGMMGAGKSTVADALGHRLGRRVVDTDTEIERWTGREIPRLFAEEGEAGFRELEHRVVVELARLHDLVVALGGGAVQRDDNVEALRFTGVLVHLDVPVAQLAARLDRAHDLRPLLPSDPEERSARIETLHAQRSPRYAEVRDVVVDASGSVDTTVTAIVDWAMSSGDVLTPSEHEQVMR
jgi:shikimate kinase